MEIVIAALLLLIVLSIPRAAAILFGLVQLAFYLAVFFLMAGAYVAFMLWITQ